MSKSTIAIRTLLPIHVPLSLNPGINRRASEFDEGLRKQLAKHTDLSLPKPKQTQEYESVNADSWESRLCIWQRPDLNPDLKVHVFANSIAVAELKLNVPYNNDHEALEKDCQRLSKELMDELYPELVLAIERFVAQDDEDLFTLLPDWQQDLKVFWISRTIMLKQEQLQEQSIKDLLNNWLSHTHRPQDAADIIATKKDHSLTWLNYVLVDYRDPWDIVEGVVEGVVEEIVEEGEGGNEKGVGMARPEAKQKEDPRLDAMILAQYYYTAQEYCNQRLSASIDSAYNHDSIEEVQEQLSDSRLISRLHQVDYYEHLKFLTRPKRLLLEGILDCWDYSALQDNSQRMIDICSSRIEEVESRKRERASRLTDFLLVALSFFAVFELSLYLMELSREMMSRPALSYTDENSSLFLEVIANVDTDVMFGTGFALTLLLVLVYQFIKSRE
ncbi:hypothetical protein [uncultured Pseudoteredinibacter sp.]|uniref:hypothetical protein n=1 Tax=uncultured Pseudoteredinibacter sp. TaxID=1641701 RepID=UPI00260AB6FF|nr:hypothetical protein [uncultured Pseudoteredinibacter sp.]